MTIRSQSARITHSQLFERTQYMLQTCHRDVMNPPPGQSDRHTLAGSDDAAGLCDGCGSLDDRYCRSQRLVTPDVPHLHGDAALLPGDAARTFGPLARFDPHTPDPADPALSTRLGARCCTSGTALPPAAVKFFGDAGEALICPSWRVALLERVTR